MVTNLFKKSIEDITEEDLQVLIENSISESKHIEYKSDLRVNSESEKKEFLADISSFANASGGLILYGITEENGIPKEIKGIDLENIDKEIVRLEQIITSGIEPRMTGINFHSVKLHNFKYVLMIHIPKSWISPHRVKYDNKFYRRSTRGKYPMDIEELRIAFSFTRDIADRIRNFRIERISKILSGETPVPFIDSAKIVIHIIPVVSFNPHQLYDLKVIDSNPYMLKPVNSASLGSRKRWNFDGLLSFSTYPGYEDRACSYVQLYKNGIIEAVEGYMLDPKRRQDNLLKIHPIYEKVLIESVREYLKIQRTLNVDLPIFIYLSLLKVKGYSISYDLFLRSDFIDRENLFIPEVIIENYDVDISLALKPCFDFVWNACGEPQSFNYDENGNFKFS